LRLQECEILYIKGVGLVRIFYSYLCIKGVMKAFVARGVTLGPETSVEGHNTVRATNANYARGTYKILCPVEVLNFIIIYVDSILK
jgi:hypothetical protein